MSLSGVVRLLPRIVTSATVVTATLLGSTRTVLAVHVVVQGYSVAAVGGIDEHP